MIHQRKICIRTFKKQCKLLRYALLGPSVCLSVCHTPVLCWNS